jgi:sterol desaturase/sphingolipid hydroxylase (fatty acid hydroxylase superfamily)
VSSTLIGSATEAVEVERARRHLNLPVAVIAGATLWLVWEGWRGVRTFSTPARFIASERTELIGPAIIGFVLSVIVLERLWPAVRRPLLARGHVHDALYLLLYAAAVVPVIALIGVGFAGTLHRGAPWLDLPGLAAVPRGVLVVIAVVAMDFCNWLAHWANHRVESLWRLHAVHHTQEEMSILTSFRAHPLVHTSFLVSTIPVMALGASGAVPALIITAYICLSTLPHANVPWGFGPLGRVIVSPAYHRYHHAAEGRIDVNLGTVLTIWDIATRRAVFPAGGRAEAVPTGLARRPIPVEQEGPRPRHLTRTAQQLVEPFVRTGPARRAA